VNKERFWPRAIGAVSVVALVLVTNEGYWQVRSLVDAVGQSKHDIAQLKRDLYVLQVQLDNGPVPAPAPASVPTSGIMSSAMPAPLALPLPVPMGQSLPLPEGPTRTRPKLQSNDEAKSMVSVVLMGDTKPSPGAASGAPTAKPSDGPKLDVRLIGEGK
jgi:hypothetical protein